MVEGWPLSCICNSHVTAYRIAFKSVGMSDSWSQGLFLFYRGATGKAATLKPQILGSGERILVLAKSKLTNSLDLASDLRLSPIFKDDDSLSTFSRVDVSSFLSSSYLATALLVIARIHLGADGSISCSQQLLKTLKVLCCSSMNFDSVDGF